VFGVFAELRTAEASAPFQPITTNQKSLSLRKIHSITPFFLSPAFFAGLSQLQAQTITHMVTESKGLHIVWHRICDQVISNFFPEAIIPALFHMDPRYFSQGRRLEKDSLVYAVSHMFMSKSDSGAITFNSPEVLATHWLSLTDMSYHTHRRTAGDALTQWGTYIG